MQVWSHRHHSLDMVRSVAGGVSLELELPNSRRLSLDRCVVDSGSNLPLVTEDFCKAHGITIHSMTPPCMKDIFGDNHTRLMGRTPSLVLTLGPDTAVPTRLTIPGAYVVPGNAGGMYEFCLDKQTLSPVYGHVNPAYQRLCWYPRAQQADFTVLNGVPVSTVPEGVATAAMAHGPVRQQPVFVGCAAVATHQPGSSSAAMAAFPLCSSGQPTTWLQRSQSRKSSLQHSQQQHRTSRSHS